MLRPIFLSILMACSVWAQVDFATQVHPLLASRCAACHTGDKAQAGLRVDQKDSLAKVSAKIVPKVKGDSGMRMPPNGAPLTPAEIGLLERWIAGGMPWTDTRPKPASAWTAPLAPRRPPLPESREPHPVDKFIDAYFRERGIQFQAAVADNLFARRVYLDIWGVTPTPEQMQAFLAAKNPDKRTRLVETLLADARLSAGHAISFWNDLLRNDTRTYHGESRNITKWLLRALETNMTYDEMVRQLVNPPVSPEAPDSPEGFLLGVNWRGDVNASQLPHMQAAQNTAQVFLGVNLKCASCHDSFINKYKLRQSYGMAALFSAEPELELVRCDVKTGMMQGPEFLFPELGRIPALAETAERRQAAAALFTSPQNGRLARTLVNRFWGRLFGRALVEPVDDMDAEPWHPDLLDWLASDFADHGYDLKYLQRLLMTSRTWQQASVAPSTGQENSYTFRGPLPRRLTGEQFVDTLSALTGEWRLLQEEKSARTAREWEFRATPLSRALGRPIRDQVYTTRPAEASTLQALELVNGEALAVALRRGAQRLTGTLPAAPAALYDSKTVRRSGVWKFEIPVEGLQGVWLLTEDAGSYDAERTIAGWHGLSIDSGRAVGPAAPQSRKDVQTPKESFAGAWILPYSKPIYLPLGKGARTLRGRVVLDNAGALSDVNSAVRFYVFPAQPDLHQLVLPGGPPPVAAPHRQARGRALAQALFLQTLGRAASPAEEKLALSALSSGGASGLEDLLWTLLLSPEFQYVD